MLHTCKVALQKDMSHQTGGLSMAGAGFHSFAKLRAQRWILAICGVNSADCHKENIHTADCKSQQEKC
jgi:hypothetical protein